MAPLVVSNSTQGSITPHSTARARAVRVTPLCSSRPLISKEEYVGSQCAPHQRDPQHPGFLWTQPVEPDNAAPRGTTERNRRNRAYTSAVLDEPGELA